LPLSRKEKEELVTSYTERFEKGEAAILVDYRGLSVPEITALRTKVRPSGGEVHVVKNTLVKLAIANLGAELPDELLNGPTAVTFCHGDISGTAKSLTQFANTSEKFVIKGGLLGTKVITVDDVKRLAALPGRDVLLAKVAGGIQSPLSGLVGVLGGPLRALAYVLQARADQLQEA